MSWIDFDSYFPFRNIFDLEELFLSYFKSFVFLEEWQLFFLYRMHQFLQSALFQRIELIEANTARVHNLSLNFEKFSPWIHEIKHSGVNVDHSFRLSKFEILSELFKIFLQYLDALTYSFTVFCYLFTSINSSRIREAYFL